MADVGGDDGDYGQDIVWVCTECGRHHQKHSPPCSRCGNVDLEKQRPDFSDLEEPGGTSYLDVLEPKYAAGYLAVIGFAILVALSLTGVVYVPFLGGPSPPGAPGAADTYRNVSLDAVEEAYLQDVNVARAERGVRTLSVESSLDRTATHVNQQLVRAARGDGARPDVRSLVDRYDPQCSATPASAAETAVAGTVFGADDGTIDPDAVAERLPIHQLHDESGLVAGKYAGIGVDVHVAPDDTVYATVIVC